MTWQLDTELDVFLRWIIGNGHGARTLGDDRWSLSSSPSLVRAVRGSIEIIKEIRTVEICGGDPRVFVVTVTFPVNQVLGFAAISMWRIRFLQRGEL
jgi:hypothetical protein